MTLAMHECFNGQVQYTKKLGIFKTIVDRKKVLKQAGVVHNIKSQ